MKLQDFYMVFSAAFILMTSVFFFSDVKKVEKAASATALFDQSTAVPFIKNIALLNDIDPQLILAVVQIESNFNTHAVSHKNAIGLMQVTEPAAIDYCGFERGGEMGIYHNPKENVECGINILKAFLRASKGSVPRALAYYNCGIGGYRKYPNTCKGYAKKVIAKYTSGI